MMPASDLVGVVQDLSAPARRLGTLAIAAIVATLILLALCAWPLLPALTAAPGRSPSPVPAEVLAKSQTDFDAAIAQAADRINARAPFGAVRVPEKEAPKPAVAARYAGPALVGMAADEAWFADGKRVKLGATDFGVSVLALDPPWGARVLWSGAEFSVSLFDRNPLNLSQPMSVWQGAPPPAPITPPSPPKPATAPAPVPGNPPPGAANAPPPQPQTFPVPAQGFPVPPPPPADGDGDNQQPAPPPPPPPADPERRSGANP
ncbi:MAG: hypothetical protein ACKVS8_05810 [Phycisphaerales bacterium]